MKHEVSVKDTVNAWHLLATEIFFKMMHEQKGAEITADTFARECRKERIPPLVIARQSSILFKSMKAQGYIKKTQNYKLSERNGSSPLPIYTVVWSGEV